MSRTGRFLFIFSLLLIPLGILNSQDELRQQALTTYKQAIHLYNDPQVTDQKDRVALSKFYQVIRELEKSTNADSILWDSYLKAAIYEQTLGNFEKAIPLLLNNIRIEQQALVKDQQTFLPHLYLANSYYMAGRYDSARYFYEQSAEIAHKTHIEEGLERLYNAFGVMNFETGNYSQSRNNFEKAIQLLQQKNRNSEALMVNFKSNLASSLRKMELYDQALAVYKELLPLGQNTDELWQNIASTQIAQGQFREALANLKKVKTVSPGLYNNLGWAYLQSGNTDSAGYYLLLAVHLQQSTAKHYKSIDAGLTQYYLGMLNKEDKSLTTALQQFQRALIEFLPAFNDTSIRNNPSSFAGSFAFTEIFETLLAKARVFEQLYAKTKQTADLQSSLDAYKTLYQLADYTEKTYASDESRIALNRRKYQSHDEPIETAIALFRLTNKKEFLEDAFYFDERNKASVLVSGISEKQLKMLSKVPPALLNKETNLRESINALTLKLSSTADSSKQAMLLQKSREKELELETLTNTLNKLPAYAKARFSSRFNSLTYLKDSLVPMQGAILSYHMGTDSLLVWYISRQGFKVQKIAKTDSFEIQIRSLTSHLRAVNNFSVLQNRTAMNSLYRLLIKPFEADLAGCRQLMIIPDDELNELPFEALLDDDDRYLLERFNILYNYSCSLLTVPAEAEPGNKQSLGMAPYITGIANQPLPALSHSKEEIEGVNNQVLLGNKATKASFMKEAGRYDILHLATHAFANDSVPEKSYISFYPSANDSFDNRVYTPEIYTLPLDSTRLVILSACETGSGKLLKGEGILGISRAFSYAGCQNLLSSLWKADDASTAYINHQLRKRLQSNSNMADCFQQARLDYLNDEKIDPRFKTPAYWAHLRLTGQFSPTSTGNFPLWISLAGAAVALFVVLYLKRKKAGE